MGFMAVLPYALQAAQIGSNIWGGMQAESGASAANSLNYQMFKENMEFQERMYKNRHTYEVEDLRRAGLNPVLSANTAGAVPGGSGYATPINEKAMFAELTASSALKSAALAENMEKVKQEKVNTQIRRDTAESEVSIAKSAAKIKEQDARFSTSFPGKIAYWIQKYNPLSGLFK